MTVLAVAPHPDDEVLGCGGSLARHAGAGERVEAAFLTSGELALRDRAPEEARRLREGEAAAAAAVLGIDELMFLRLSDWTLSDAGDAAVDSVAALIDRIAPATVYLPHPGEWHPDHRAAAAIVQTAAERTGLPSSALLAYEIWTPLSAFSVVEDIGAVIDRKREAMRCYTSQSGEFDYDRALVGLGMYRGALAGRCAYAEVFARW